MREKELRQKLNNEFKNFTKSIEKLYPGAIEFDVPFRDLGFDGVPTKTNVLLMPTSTCIVSLIESPFFVVSLEDIEIIHFERVSFQLKNFDIVLVFRDYSKPVQRIS